MEVNYFRNYKSMHFKKMMVLIKARLVNDPIKADKIEVNKFHLFFEFLQILINYSYTIYILVRNLNPKKK